MPSLIQELDNDGLLLLYAADELPPEDRAEVEQMLATDAGLRVALAAVRHDVAAAGAALAAADHVDPPAASPSAESVALRRVSRALWQWQAERLVRRRPPAAVEPQPRFSRWVYAAVATAAVACGTLSWWGMQLDRPGRLEATSPTDPPPTEPLPTTRLAATGLAATQGLATVPPSIRPASIPPGLPDLNDGPSIMVDPLAATPDGTSPLAEAERQAGTLARADSALDAPPD